MITFYWGNHLQRGPELSDNELFWDNSPEQYEITISADEELEDALQPRFLFPEDQDSVHGRHRLAADADAAELESLTSTDSEGEVFPNEEVDKHLSTNKRLVRQNAMKRRPGRSVHIRGTHAI